MLEDIQLLDQAVGTSPEAIRSLLLDPLADLKLRAIAAWAVGAAHEDSFAGLLEELVHERTPAEILLEVAKALVHLGKGSQLFRGLLRQAKDPQAKRIAAYALGHLRDRSATDDLCRVVISPSEEPSVRAQVAEALGYLGDKESVACLLEATRDPSPEVRFWSVFALGQLGDLRAVPVLEELGREDDVTVGGWWKISREARAALEEIRTRRKSE